jgi:pyridoxal phosphate enzyme (YggS family)
MANFSLLHRYESVITRIENAAAKVGRQPEDVRLVVVTKGHPIKIVKQAVALGVKTLGENYVEEAIQKMDAVGKGAEIEWHMIGHIQSRKARSVCEYFDFVHSVDSLRLAKRLDRFAAEAGKRLPTLLEFNVSGEETKYGWLAWNELEWEPIAQDIAQIVELKNLEILGLMTMPPYFSDAELSRPYFILLRRLRDFLAAKFSQSTWEELSMGMSTDYEVAIEEGATIVRIGTAIMGERS